MVSPRSSDALGLRSLGEVVDLLDMVEHETSGIHIVITDRPDAVERALETRLPAGIDMAPLVDDARLSALVERPPGVGDEPRGRLLVATLDPRDARVHPVVQALDLRREWLLAPGNHALVMVAGETLEDADEAYLALQARAPNFWSFRTRVYRVGGPDDNPATRARVRQLASAHPRADVDAHMRTLDRDWEPWRLWRGPTRVRAWLESAAPGRSPGLESLGLKLSTAAVGQERAAAMRATPRERHLPPVARTAWPRPPGPAAPLDAQGQGIVDSVGARLRNAGRAYVYQLSGDGPGANRDQVLTAALVYGGGYQGVVHLDASHGLARAVADWLGAAGMAVDICQGVTPENAVAYLEDALHGQRALVVLTHARPMDADRVSAALTPAGAAILAGVQPGGRFPFALCHGPDRAAWAQWCAAELFAWAPGVRPLGFVEPAEWPLLVRESLARAHHVLLFAGPGHPSGWQLAAAHRHRVLGVAVGDEPLPDATLSWLRLDPADEKRSRAQLIDATRTLAGPAPGATTSFARAPRHAAAPFPGLDTSPAPGPDAESPWTYRELGQPEEALAASQEAVAQYRGLAEARPDAFLPDLAMSLNNLGVRYRELGQREEALAASQEAVAQYRGLAEARPDAFLPDLAMGLNNLGVIYSELGQPEEALAASQEAVAQFRGLAEARPDAFLPDLAGSLNNLGNCYRELGQREEALAASREAIRIHVRLARALPARFVEDLARCAHSLTVHLSALGMEPAQDPDIVEARSLLDDLAHRI